MPIVKIKKRPKTDQEEETVIDLVYLPDNFLAQLTLHSSKRVINDSGYAYLEKMGYRDISMDFEFVNKNYITNYKNKLISEINNADKMLLKILKIEEHAD
jgi:spore germination protein YaaH